MECHKGFEEWVSQDPLFESDQLETTQFFNSRDVLPDADENTLGFQRPFFSVFPVKAIVLLRIFN